MTRDKAIDRVAKLLALAASSNKNEAQGAQRAAARLKKKFKITKREIDARVGRNVRRVDAGGVGLDPYWRVGLARAVADLFRCAALKKDERVYFTGRGAEAAAGTYARVATEIVSACHASWLRHAGGAEGSLFLVWSTTFKAEAVRAVSERVAGACGAVVAATSAVQTVSGGTPFGTPCPPPPTARRKKTPDELQVERALREIRALVEDFALSVGFFAAQVLAERIVRLAGEAGRSFGMHVYLGAGERLLPASCEMPFALEQGVR